MEEDDGRHGGGDRSRQRLPLWYPLLDDEEAEHDRGEATRAEPVDDLLLGRDFDDPLFLQVTEAGPSALEALGETRRATASIAEIEGLLWHSFLKFRNGSGPSQDAANMHEYRYLTLRFSRIISGP